MTLTPAQTAVIAATEPYLLVSATAGAGKSRVLIERIKRLVRDGVKPERITVICYTNAAAAVLVERISGEPASATMTRAGSERDAGRGRSTSRVTDVLTSSPCAGSPLGFCGTLHGFLLRLLTRYGQVIGLCQSLSVVDEEEQEALMMDIIEETAWKGSLTAVKKAIAEGPVHRLNPMTGAEIAAEGFWQRLKADGILTYDSILHHGERLLKAMSAKGIELEVEHLLVDEANDLSDSDWRIIDATNVPNVFIVGDSDQRIMSFRGASEEFEKRCKLATP